MIYSIMNSISLWIIINDELEFYKHKNISFLLKPEAQPIFLKPRPVPFVFIRKTEKEL